MLVIIHCCVCGDSGETGTQSPPVGEQGTRDYWWNWEADTGGCGYRHCSTTRDIDGIIMPSGFTSQPCRLTAIVG